MRTNSNRWIKWAPVPMRLVMGVGFLVHGWAKLSRGPGGFGKLLAQIGLPFPGLTAWMVTLLEIAGGAALIIGAFVAIVSIPLIVSMVVAMITVHMRYGFSSIKTIGLTANGPVFGPPGYEINLLYIAGLLILILAGAGPLSIDALLARRWRVQKVRAAGSAQAWSWGNGLASILFNICFKNTETLTADTLKSENKIRRAEKGKRRTLLRPGYSKQAARLSTKGRLCDAVSSTINFSGWEWFEAHRTLRKIRAVGVGETGSHLYYLTFVSKTLKR